MCVCESIKQLILSFYPYIDVNPGKDTTAKFQEINHAYGVLTKQHELFEIRVDNDEEGGLVDSTLLIRKMEVALDGNPTKQRLINDHPLLLEGSEFPMVSPLMAIRVSRRLKIDKRLLNRTFGVPVEHRTSPVLPMDLLVEDIERA